MNSKNLIKKMLFLVAVILLTACSDNKQKQPEQTETQPSPMNDNLALTPPMGWNSWNGLGKNVSEDLVKAIADSFLTMGLKDAGYNYIVLDDFWQGVRDSATGMLPANPDRFPSGIKALADYVHARGLKLGIYSDAGTMTCGDQPGSYGFEEIDAKAFAEWGVDYLKYDYCHCPDYASLNNDYKMAIDRYKAMGDALKATGRPIVFSICEWGPRSPWLWGKEVGGHLWRTSYDVGDKWDDPRNEHSQIGILTSIDVMCDLERFAGPGGWNDPDMLVIGLSNSGYIKGGGCTDAEYRTQMSMWCMLSAPLMIGCGITDMSDATRTILLNKDVIAIDQDPLGKQAFRVWRKDGVEAWKKPMADGKIAIAFLNRNSTPESVTVPYDQLELEKGSAYNVYDAWKHEQVKQDQGSLSSKMVSHETQVFVLTPAAK
ncbi:MAG TPA: glycoside hydrolase family 27 protein [Bacteroidales bacterium]|nr:glycoside hydrolase family 27 protein [Bacteroidales bacterium]